jgi:hypothetical protein
MTDPLPWLMDFGEICILAMVAACLYRAGR